MGDRTIYSAGEYGNTVTIFERKPGGNFYIRVPHPDYSGGYREKSLGHRNEQKAKSRADRIAAELREGLGEEEKEPTLQHIFGLYKRHESGDKGESQQYTDRKAIAFWKRALGAGKRPSEISSAEWSDIMRARKQGRIDARARPVDVKDRKPVSWNTVWRDLYWLQKVLNWATRWRTSEGRYLLPENPIRGYRMPDRKTPNRPVASRDRYEALVEQAREQTMAVTWSGSKERVRSHLWELLDIVVGTGRRIGAVCALRFRDLDLEETESAPHGAVVWPGDTDKMDESWRAPLDPIARAAIDRARERFPGIGDAPLFPKPTDRGRPVDYHTAYSWLQDAETDAELSTMEGGAWHPYRRMWATERMHLPRKAVAKAGGWKDPSVMETCYQEADEAMVRDVVLDRRDLRESRG